MICRYFQVARADMVYLKFILEAYEGMNVMSTVDNGAGIIRIAIMAGFEEDMDMLLAELGTQVVMQPVAWQGDGDADFQARRCNPAPGASRPGDAVGRVRPR